LTLATSKNLTVLGIATILGALSTAAVSLFDGDPATNPDWSVVVTALISGLGMVLAKGAKTTGGTVDPAGNPVP
jgi:hypothetical protein